MPALSPRTSGSATRTRLRLGLPTLTGPRCQVKSKIKNYKIPGLGFDLDFALTVVACWGRGWQANGSGVWWNHSSDPFAQPASSPAGLPLPRKATEEGGY